jgi:hypothetical protein
VLPGVYTVTIKARGADGPVLKGELRVDSDPRVTFNDADRRARQTTLLTLYELQKSLAATRATTATARLASDTELGKLQADLTAELSTASTLSRAIEGFSGLPTADQRRQVEWVLDDAAKTVEALNRVLHTDMPAPPRLMAIPAKRQ